MSHPHTVNKTLGLRWFLVLALGLNPMWVLVTVAQNLDHLESGKTVERELKAGEGRSGALRNVQLKLLKNPRRQHPFYWASFIQSGKWANLDGKR